MQSRDHRERLSSRLGRLEDSHAITLTFNRIRADKCQRRSGERSRKEASTISRRLRSIL